MAADAFNSAGGYTVNIPPIPVIDSNGNITSNRATLGNVAVSGNIAVSGSIVATNFYGNVQGNINANITIVGTDGAMVYNNLGVINTAEGVVYDNNNHSLTVQEELTANVFSLGLGENQFYQISSFVANTNSSAPNQVLHRVSAGSVISMDYTVIATDVVANTRQTSKLVASVLGNDVGYLEIGTIDAPVTSPGVGDFKVNFVPGGGPGNVTLTVTPVSSNLTNYKILITSYKA